MELHLKIIGSLFIVLSFLHILLPKYFRWEEELSRISLGNKQIMQVHTFFIALLVFLLGCLNYFCAEDLLNTSLGKKICLGMFVFWCFRWLSQFFWYSSSLWKGKVFESSIHVLAALFWTYLCIIYGILAFK